MNKQNQDIIVKKIQNWWNSTHNSSKDHIILHKIKIWYKNKYNTLRY